MSTNERTTINTSRSSSISSQMAAITAAQDREDSSMSSPAGSVKGKLDQMKQEDMSMDKQDESESCGGHMSEGGKGVKKEIKTEIKSEPMDESDIKEEHSIKEEPRTPESSADIKPTLAPLEMMPGGVDKKPRRCKCFICLLNTIFRSCISNETKHS